MKDNFETFKELLGIKTEDQQRDIILNKIFEYNGVKEDHRYPVLYGTFKKDLKNQRWFITSIYSLYGYGPLKNPFTSSELIIIVNKANHKKLQIAENKKAAFVPYKGKLGYERELLTCENFVTFESLDLDNIDGSNDKAFEIRKEKICNSIEFNEKFGSDAIFIINDILRTDIENMKKAKRDLEEENKELERELSETKQAANEELERIQSQKQQAENEKKSIENEIENLRKECSRIRQFLGKPVFSDKVQMLPVEDKLEEHFNASLDFEYPKELTRPFLLALGTTQIIVLFGKPGTGKTTFVTKAAKALGAVCTIISVQNNWTESNDLLGFFNPINNTYNSTPFMEALIRAREDEERCMENGTESPLHLICLDEMNLARIEYYFAEFLSKLQLHVIDRFISVLPQYISKDIQELYDSTNGNDPDEIRKSIRESEDEYKKQLLRLGRYREFRLPGNVRFIGTINNDDTTNELSPKVIDRSFFIEMTNECFAEKAANNSGKYFPANLFSPKPSTNEISEIFKEQNPRTKGYIKSMRNIYDNLFEEQNFAETEFNEYMIISKILPSLKKAGDYKFDSETYPNAQKAFESHINGSGDSYNYLGG